MRLTAAVAASVALAATLPPQSTPLGRISFPTSGSPAAQSAFVRGVLLLHNFEYDDAIERFREAERLDPGFAMAYWGEAMCYNQPLWNSEEIDKARAALGRLAPTRAMRAAKAPTAREKAYLDAVEARLGDGDKTTRDLAYATGMADLTRQYPDDDEAAAFYALALLATIPPDPRNPEISLQAGAIASAILKKNPQHPGAAHYALHAYDDGEHAPLGLTAARLYAKIAPASSHALHMPSHIFLPLGMWDEAAASDEASWAASMAWIKRKQASLELADFHSLTWLHYEYLQQGRFVRAREILGPVWTALAELARPNALGAVGGGTGQSLAHQHIQSEIGRGFDSVSLRNELGSLRARFIVESGDWEHMKGQSTFDNIDELFALGLSSVRLGDLARADVALGHLENAAKAMPEPDGREIAAIMSVQLDGVLALALGDRPRGLSALMRATSLEARRPRPVGRPYPIKPAGELYAEALLERDPAAAVQQFRKALERTPNRAASLLGLARAARAAGREREAADAAGRFLAIWHLADPDRKELNEARSMLK